MNCPCCDQRVGNDQFGYGPWQFEHDARGQIISAKRSLAIWCGCCGVSEAIVENSGRILTARGPYHNERDLRRLERLIPYCRRQRRVPA